MSGPGVGAAPQGPGGDLVGARGPAQAEVDAPGVEGLERGELLGDDQRGVVGEHHPAGSDPQGGGGVGQVADEHGRGRAGHRRHAVVLGHPHPPVAEPLDHRGQAGGVGQGVGRRESLGHRGQVEDGERHHARSTPPGPGSSATGRAVDQGRSGRRGRQLVQPGQRLLEVGPGGPDDHGVSEQPRCAGARTAGRADRRREPNVHPRTRSEVSGTLGDVSSRRPLTARRVPMASSGRAPTLDQCCHRGPRRPGPGAGRPGRPPRSAAPPATGAGRPPVRVPGRDHRLPAAGRPGRRHHPRPLRGRAGRRRSPPARCWPPPTSVLASAGSAGPRPPPSATWPTRWPPADRARPDRPAVRRRGGRPPHRGAGHRPVDGPDVPARHPRPPRRLAHRRLRGPGRVREGLGARRDPPAQGARRAGRAVPALPEPGGLVLLARWTIVPSRGETRPVAPAPDRARLSRRT